MGKPSLYVVVRASYKEYEADLARVRGIAREQGEAISNALNNSISPKQAIKGFESLSVSLQKAIGAANAFNVKPQIQGLGELAKIAGVSAERMDYFTQAMVKTARENSLERSLQGLQRQTGMSQLAMAKFRYELGDFSGALRTVGSIAMSAAIPIAAFGTAAFLMGKSCLDAQLALQRLNVAYQSVFEGGAGAQLDFIYQQTQKIGLEFQSTAEAAKGFFAAGRDSTLAPELNNIFSAVTSASGALQLSGEQVNRTFLALGQMISKGKVQAEELRGQLGEQLPGAFQLAAKAMGMTTAELDKFMADGKLTAEDLLPKLADVLNDKYAKAAEEAGNKSQAAINRMSTEWSLFKANVLNSEAVVEMLNKVTGALESWNSANKNAEKRARIEKQMRDDGVQGSVPMHVVDSDGNITGVDYIYSNEQIKYYDALNQAYEAHQANIAQKNRESEKKLADSSSAIAAALKDTSYQKRIDLVNQNKKDNEAFITKRTAYEADGAFPDITARQKALKDLDAQQSAVNAKFQKDLEAIDNKGAKSAIAAAKAENGYAAAVAETTAQIAGYQQQLSFDKSESLGRAKAKIEAEYQQAVAKTTKEIANQVVAKKITTSEGDTLMQLKMQSLELKKQVEIREAEERAREKEIQMVGDQLNFYKELGELSGQYGNQLDMQVKLIELQASKYEDVLKIPKELVEQWKKYKLLQESYDPWDGAYRGLVKFTAEYSNEAKQWESITYSWATGFNDTTKEMWGDFLDTGKVSFDKLSTSFSTLLKNMSYQALVQPVVLSIVGVAQNSLYSATSAGQSGGGSSGSSSLYGAAGSLAQQYGMSQLMNGAGVMTGITSTVNGWGASMFPSVFAANGASNAAVNGLVGEITGTAGTLPTSTLLGTLGAAGMGYGIGSIGGTLLASLTGGNSSAMSTGGGIGGGLGAGIGSIIAPGIGTFIGGALGSLLGSGAGGLFSGGLFGGGGSEPGLWVLGNIDLDASDSSAAMEAVSRPNKGRSGFADATSQGYYIQARSRNGMDSSAASSAAKYLSQLADQVINLSASVKTSLGDIDSSLGSQYSDYLAAQKWIQVTGNGEGDDTPNVEELGKNLINQAYGRITDAVAHMDLSKVAIAADGMAADTMAEMSKAITKAASVANISTSMGDYADEYLAAIGKPLLDALNTIDTSKLALEIDKSSLAGWAQAAVAIQAMDNVKTSIDGIVTPASEMTVAMSAANTQLDTWIASLRQLGWQEEAIAEVEAKRTAYLEQYENALTRSSEQNLYLRGLALSAGTDSLSYQMQSLKYQQENELADYAKKYGSEAELLAAKAAQLNKEAYKGKTDWSNNDVYQAIKDAGMTVVEWLERFGRDEGFTQNISMYDQLMYTQQAESIQTEIDYLQRQYNSMLQEQISSAQSLVNSFDRVVDSLDETRRNLWSSDANISTSRLADARADFSTVYAKAMAGDADAMSELPSISTNLLNLGKEQIASRDVYQDLFYDVDRKLKDAQGIAKNQYDTNKLQLDTLQSQLSTQQKSHLTLAEISAKITALSGDLAAAMAKAAATPLAQTESLMQSKADQLNSVKYQGRTDWTAQGAQQEINKSGMTQDQWWSQFGINEGLSAAPTYSSTSSGQSDMALLAAKGAQLSSVGYKGNTSWTQAQVAQEIANAGMTISQWYNNFGKTEGFATGGITPANEPFWVGENGPELVVSPQQWGVINNTDSMALMRGMSGGGNIDSGSIVAAINNMNDTLRQLLTKTDRIMADQGRIRDRMDMFAQEGVTIAAA